MWSPWMTWSRWPPRHWRQRPSLSLQVRAAGRWGVVTGCVPPMVGQVPEAPWTLSAVVPVGAAVTADETEVLKAEISKAVKQVQEEGERDRLGPENWCPPNPEGSPQPDHGLSLPQTPTPISSMPATPVGTSSWMQTAWPSTCGSTRPRHWSCSRRMRTSTSSTGRAAHGQPGRCCRLGSWSSALGMGPMASPLWQRRPPQPLNVRRLLSEQASLLVTVYLRMDGTLDLRGWPRSLERINLIIF